MIRAVFRNGIIHPLDDLPESWKEGQELILEEGEPPFDPEEIVAWSLEIEEAAARIRKKSMTGSLRPSMCWRENPREFDALTLQPRRDVRK